MKNKFAKKLLASTLAFSMVLPCVHFDANAQSLNDAIKNVNLNPAFEKYLSEKNNSKTTVGGHGLGYIPEPFELKSNFRSNKNLRFISNDDLPSEYTSTAAGLVTSVKNQGAYGACWTFGTTAALESSYMKDKRISTGSLSVEPDYSEMNMVYNCAKDATRDNPYEFDNPEGGTNGMVLAYYSSGRGAVLERDDVYDSSKFTQTSGGWRAIPRSYQETKSKPVDKYVREVLLIPDVEDLNDEEEREAHRNLVKRYIKDYGSVATSFCAANLYGDTVNYYYNGNADPDHCVNIVGWDDNYPKENFADSVSGTPAHNGAFIIKNSWGTDAHDNGFFWMSYDDTWAGADAFVVTDVDDMRDKYKFDNIYQKDYFGMYNAIDLDVNELYECKVFDLKTASEDLTDVGLYTGSENVNCEFYLADIDSTGKPVIINEKLAEKNFELPGYHTVSLSKVVRLNKNKNNGKFGVVVKMTGNNVKLPREWREPGYSSKAVGARGENFVNIGRGWEDIYYEGNDFAITNLNIKAFTNKVAPTPTPTPDPAPAPAPAGGGGSSFNTIGDKTQKVEQPQEKQPESKVTIASRLKSTAYINGYGDGNFGPNDNLTCEHIANMIERVVGKDVLTPGAYSVFSSIDVKSNAKASREQMSKVLYNLINLLKANGISYAKFDKKLNFNDVKDEQFKSQLETLVSYGVINGYGDNTFKPNNFLTRAEFVKMLSKIFGRAKTWKGTVSFKDVPKSFWAYDYIMNAVNGE